MLCHYPAAAEILGVLLLTLLIRSLTNWLSLMRLMRIVPQSVHQTGSTPDSHR
jgi:hypothetical protein